MRKLVTVKTVDAINPIEGADLIEKLSIGGWNVVSQKGTFKV
jgi:predicted RNA binding protein YcfA (HicA-like mRNA interferase family)